MYDYESSDVRTWLEIDTKSIEHNYQQFRKLIKPECKMMGIVKSNAYGHGLIGYSKALDKIGADWLGVDSYVEADKLRENGIDKPILVLGHTLPRHFEEAAKKNISLTISNFGSLEKLQEFKNGSKLKIHFKIDTGMHRQGFYPEDLGKVIDLLRKADEVELEGVYSHFASAKNPAMPAETNKQIIEFEKACEKLQAAGYHPLRHIAATSGTIVFPSSHFDMVRIGIGLMGLWPSEEVKSIYHEMIPLKPALSWKTFVSETKCVKKYEGIGYGFTEKLRCDGTIAILPLGYWHGYRRALSSVGHVLIQGERCRVLGLISMDMIVVDISKLSDIKPGEIATLIGEDNGEIVDADELAYFSNTCNYEVITQLNPLIERIYI